MTTRIAGRSYGSCTDYDGDGWMDLCIIEGTVPNAPGQTQLYHATGHGTFTRHTLGTPAFMLNAVSWADYDNDGDPDLFVSAITDPSRLWRNDGRGQFTTDNLGLPTDGDTLHAAWADYDNDGDLDIALGSFANTRLYRNEGGARFVPDATLAGAYGFPTWADYDNDGHVDLLAAIGQVSPQKAALYHNNGDGTFTRVSEVFTEQADSWMGSAWGDYDNDGFLDVLLLHTGPRIRLYHNLKNANHWLKFTLIGTASNRDAIGAKVRVLATIGGSPSGNCAR
ncbi:MAG: VCBS repeat-containing protein [Verrucomicrobia bacterium]|nr:VCBS repeat-containing protein [Verrucomicrobiota bacterium]